MNKYIDKFTGAAKAIPGKYTEFLSKTAPPMKNFDYVKPHISNFGTGLQAKPGLKYKVGLGALAWGAGVAGAGIFKDKTTNLNAEALSRAVDVGNMPSMGYDAVGNAANGSYDLGATGNLVFGLHNSRRGR